MTYDTVLESLGLWEYSGSISKNFGNHQDDQEGQEYPKAGYLENFGCLDGNFTIATPHMILFWNPWDMGVLRKSFQEFWSPSG